MCVCDLIQRRCGVSYEQEGAYSKCSNDVSSRYKVCVQ